MNYFLLLFISIIIIMVSGLASTLLWVAAPLVVVFYYLISTPYYVSFTLKQARRRDHPVAKDILIILAVAGFIVGVIYTCLPYVYRTARPVSIPEAVKQVLQAYIFKVFPAAMYWATLDKASEPVSIIFVYGTSIVVNTLLYLQYGCALYYLIKLFSKDKPEP